MSSITKSCEPHLVALGKTPLCVVDICEGAGNIAMGVVASALSILTGGAIPAVNQFADENTKHSYKLLPKLFRRLISVMNPQSAKIKLVPHGGAQKCALITPTVFGIAVNLGNTSSTKLERHLFSRCAFLAFAVMSLVARVIDFIVGIFAALAALVTLGQCESVNKLAIEQLGVLGIVDDLCKGIRGIVNPQQFAAECHKPVHAFH